MTSQEADLVSIGADDFMYGNERPDEVVTIMMAGRLQPGGDKCNLAPLPGSREREICLKERCRPS